MATIAQGTRTLTLNVRVPSDKKHVSSITQTDIFSNNLNLGKGTQIKINICDVDDKIYDLNSEPQQVKKKIPSINLKKEIIFKVKDKKEETWIKKPIVREKNVTPIIKKESATQLKQEIALATCEAEYDKEVQMQLIHIMGYELLIRLDEPILYHPNTLAKVGIIKDNLDIEWY